jgi:hypothetical protein
VTLGLAISLIIFCLLSSGSLVSTARSMRIGPLRSVALPIANGIDRVANFLSLNRPMDAVNGALGREEPNAEFEIPVAATQPADVTATTVLPPLRSVTATVPLVVSVVGDSMAQPIGEFLTAEQTDGQPYSVSYEFKISSGLARPDYFNWPARLGDLVATSKPEALVMVFGGNDTQELTDPMGNVIARPGSAEWEREYRARVAGVMDYLKADGRRLVWLLPPRMAKASQDGPAQVMHRVLSEEAASRPWVLPVDTAALTSGPNGEFADVVSVNGADPIDCRQQDGVHFTTACSELVTSAIVAAINQEWEIGGAAGGASTAGTSPASASPADTSGEVGGQDANNTEFNQMATTVPTTIPGP